MRYFHAETFAKHRNDSGSCSTFSCAYTTWKRNSLVVITFITKLFSTTDRTNSVLRRRKLHSFEPPDRHESLRLQTHGFTQWLLVSDKSSIQRNFCPFAEEEAMSCEISHEGRFRKLNENRLSARETMNNEKNHTALVLLLQVWSNFLETFQKLGVWYSL
jgi:hypothetical protein